MNRTALVAIAFSVVALASPVRAGTTSGSKPAASHRPEDPQVVHLCAVAPEILCVAIQAQDLKLQGQMPYQRQPSDEIRADGTKLPAWHHGRVVSTKKNLSIHRDTDGDGEKEGMGALIINEGLRWPGRPFEGHALEEENLLEAGSYRISSGQDPAYATPVHPVAVYRKSKPNDHHHNQMPVRHWIYLKLPQPLQEAASYTIHFDGLNTRQPTATYLHRPAEVRSQAVHASHVGYRPDDPFKRAYVSTWLGTGGALSYDLETFYLVEEESGERVYKGQVRLGWPAEKPEHMKQEKNYSKTDVYHLDFGDFTRPGLYRVLVPGIGTSYPFRIGRESWTEAFRTSMMGFLHQRSGIELGPPFTDYVRPRPMHPADGVTIFQTDVTIHDGESGAIRSSLTRLLGPSLDPSKVDKNPDAWGGYMDAGDWDRRSQHLKATYLHLELCELFPDYFRELKLALPPEEAENGLPDVLDEALWNLDFYRRLQREDGGVGGGVESTAHPRDGECSWQESLLIGAFTPDATTSYRYAACAAKASRLLEKYDAELAGTYRETAERAWRWAEAEDGEPGGRRTLAAVELYHTTGEAPYRDAAGEGLMAEKDFGRIKDAWFAYALLGEELADPALKQRAVAGFRKLADATLEFAEGNAFSISTSNPHLPMMGYVGYWSTPEMTAGPVLPRAHYLTGEEEYLAGAVAATNYMVGTNPMNMTLTTGLGHDYPRHPLHIDSRNSGRPAPAGITVYGPWDPAREGRHVDWAHKWRLGPTMVPDSRTWPAPEFYVDIDGWPAMCEYTVHQTMSHTSYYWGYLAARR